MFSSSVPVVLAACYAIAVNAFETITVPGAIPADSKFTMTATAGSNDTSYSTYRVYLATTPPGYSGGPSCYLVNSTSISTTTLQLSIPANFGPNGDYYSIATREFPSADSSYFTFSKHFYLSGSSVGNWSAYENNLQGGIIWDADDMPCAAYNCARQCAMAGYPEDLRNTALFQQSAYSTMTQCIMKCPGVSQRDSAVTTVATTTATVVPSGMATSTKTNSVADASATATATTAGSASAASGGAARASSTGAASMFTAPASFLAVGGVLALLV
ncbi:hypothetical protein LTR66_012962 [Elasticomyces elasticus]|nr:hypothetical protein LTR66_012962 [Elasticomyces elasticus]